MFTINKCIAAGVPSCLATAYLKTPRSVESLGGKIYHGTDSSRMPGAKVGHVFEVKKHLFLPIVLKLLKITRKDWVSLRLEQGILAVGNPLSSNLPY